MHTFAVRRRAKELTSINEASVHSAKLVVVTAFMDVTHLAV